MINRVLLLSLILILSACGGGSDDATSSAFNVDSSGNSSFDISALQSNLTSYPIGTLTDSERNGLLLMREEEKLARDVYQALYNLHSINAFNNISDSENTHTLAVKALLDRYNVIDPVANLATGVFATEDMQQLYSDLVSAGTPDQISALRVGVLIEEMDIFDIENLKNQVDANDDILMVYDSLQKGSRNHLRSFYRLLKNAGADYVPQFISQEQFNEIINSPIENGGG